MLQRQFTGNYVSRIRSTFSRQAISGLSYPGSVFLLHSKFVRVSPKVLLMRKELEIGLHSELAHLAILTRHQAHMILTWPLLDCFLSLVSRASDQLESPCPWPEKKGVDNV